jgi:hypothetical protein
MFFRTLISLRITRHYNPEDRMLLNLYILVYFRESAHKIGYVEIFKILVISDGNFAVLLVLTDAYGGETK